MDVEYYHDISLYNDNFHPYSYSHFETPKVPAAPSSSSSSSASLRKGKWTVSNILSNLLLFFSYFRFS